MGECQVVAWAAAQKSGSAARAVLRRDVEDMRDGIMVGRIMNGVPSCEGIVHGILHALSWPAPKMWIASPAAEPV